MGMKCIGIDVGGTSVKIGLFETTGELLDKWEVKTRKENGGANILPDVAASIRGKLQERGLELKKDIAGAGLGVPGPVLSDGSVEVCVNLGWRNINPQKELSELLDGIPVKSGNDANVAALGEMWQGGGKDFDSLVLLTLGTGLGCGIIESGRLVSGSFGMGGELGHIQVEMDEKEACNCGGHGCLEQYASATGIARVAKRMLDSCDTESVLCGREEITAKDVLDAAKAGDELAAASTAKSMEYLGRAMSYVSHITDPECFVIGGGVSRAGEYLLNVIREKYVSYFHVQEPQAEIRLAELGNDAGIYGAAKLILG